MDVCSTYHYTSMANATNGEKSLCIRMPTMSSILYTENCSSIKPVEYNMDTITFLDLKLSRGCFNNFEFKKFVESYLKIGPQDKVLHVCNDAIYEPLLHSIEWDIFSELINKEHKINIHLEILNIDYKNKSDYIFCSNQLKKIDFSKFRQTDYFHVLSDNEAYHYPIYSKFYNKKNKIGLEQWSKNYLDNPILAQERLINQKGIKYDPKANRTSSPGFIQRLSLIHI